MDPIFLLCGPLPQRLSGGRAKLRWVEKNMKASQCVVRTFSWVIFAMLQGVTYAGVRAAAPDPRAAVEAAVRASAEAFAALNCAKVNDNFAPGARWIEASYPQAADAESAAWCKQARAAGVHMTFDLHDFNVQVDGRVAWATVVVEGHFHASTPEARALLARDAHDPAEWHTTMIDSVVLRRIGRSWLVVLEHRSLIPVKSK